MNNWKFIKGQEEYLETCLNASKNEEDFKVFKKQKSFKVVLEHCDSKIGNECIEIVKSENPDLLTYFYFNKFITNDDAGGASKNCEFIGKKVSANTLKYMKVLSDLITHIGSLDNFEIIEIGGGYGGQCKIISDRFKFKSYTLIDLLEPLTLQKKYLENFQVENLDFYTPENLPPKKQYDLVISNYAISELISEAQNEYFEKIIKFCKHGYLTLNGILYFNSDLDNLFKPKCIKDLKSDHEGKCNIIIW